jgi:hypothetical protein
MSTFHNHAVQEQARQHAILQPTNGDTHRKGQGNNRKAVASISIENTPVLRASLEPDLMSDFCR